MYYAVVALVGNEVGRSMGHESKEYVRSSYWLEIRQREAYFLGSDSFSGSVAS